MSFNYFFRRLFELQDTGYRGKKIAQTMLRFFFAEEEGFEPPVPRGTTVFKTAAFDHSATPLYMSRSGLFRMGLQMYFVF